jgi:hypothetical protein
MKLAGMELVICAARCSAAPVGLTYRRAFDVRTLNETSERAIPLSHDRRRQAGSCRKALRERYGLTESENPAPHERERYTFPRAPCVPTVPRTLAITPYAASLLNRELRAPAVVPRRSAMSLVVSPFGAARNNSITYFGNIVLMIARPPRMPRYDGDAGRASRVRAVNIGETRPSECGGWWRRLPRMIIARPCCLACPRRRKQARIARAGSSGTPRSFRPSDNRPTGHDSRGCASRRA